jgi:4-hydroxy-2-oxoheptanedioate aldolase
MKMPKNAFKSALQNGQHQLGIWNTIGGNTVCEYLASAGFDWILVDTEHAPVDVVDVLPSLQAIAGYPDVSAIVRPADNDPVLIKRLLDMGAQTLMIPYVQTASEAEQAVRSMRYAPRGIRGLAGIHRASRFGQVRDYASNAEDELCLIVQVETRQALDNLEAIATVDGVDGVFIGPADLSASMGYIGQTGHPEVVEVILLAIEQLKQIGVPAGILTLDETFARECIKLGASFTAVGVDMALLIDAVAGLRKRF